MLVGLLLFGLTALPGHSDLDSLDREIAALEGQRAQLGTFADNARRDQVDRKIALLRRTRSRAAAIVQRRVDACVATWHRGMPPANRGAPPPGAPPPGAPPPGSPPPGSPTVLPSRQAQMIQAECIRQAQSVVPRVLRAEEIRDRLKYEDWTMDNADERRGLERELEALEAGLL
ncbi:MAG: hypothetical protein JXR83_15470 [Deltaproteobacteria bacterium]|nr:hypothetical protein [Deltaproteobacteria bacterium]